MSFSQISPNRLSFEKHFFSNEFLLRNPNISTPIRQKRPIEEEDSQVNAKRKLLKKVVKQTRCYLDSKVIYIFLSFYQRILSSCLFAIRFQMKLMERNSNIRVAKNYI